MRQGDNTESQMTSKKDEDNENESPKRKTFDDYAVMSFMENPDLYKEKIAEYHKAQEDELEEKIQDIQSKLQTAANRKKEMNEQRLIEMKGHIGDPAVVKSTKEKLNMEDAKDSLSQYIAYQRRMQKMKKTLKTEKEKRDYDFAERTQKKQSAMRNHKISSQQMQEEKVRKLEDMSKRRESARERVQTRIETEKMTLREINRLR